MNIEHPQTNPIFLESHPYQAKKGHNETKHAEPEALLHL